MYLKERLLISLNPQKFFLARTNAKSKGLCNNYQEGGPKTRGGGALS